MNVAVLGVFWFWKSVINGCEEQFIMAEMASARRGGGGLAPFSEFSREVGWGNPGGKDVKISDPDEGIKECLGNAVNTLVSICPVENKFCLVGAGAPIELREKGFCSEQCAGGLAKVFLIPKFEHEFNFGRTHNLSPISWVSDSLGVL